MLLRVARDWDFALDWLPWMACVALYLTPALLVMERPEAPRRRVIISSVLLGWTIVGWIHGAALAVRREPARPEAARA